MPRQLRNTVYQERAVEADVAGLRNGTYRSARVAQLAHPEATIDKIYRRMRGTPPSSSRDGYLKSFTPNQENALIKYIKFYGWCGKESSKERIIEAAHVIRKSYGINDLIHPSSMNRFFKRMKQQGKLHWKKTTPLSFERTHSLQEEEIESHLKKWENSFEEWEIERENIWNFDETGFRIGCMDRRYVWVVQQEAEKRIYLNDPCNRESVTVIFAINATGKRSPLLIIMAAAFVKEKHLDDSLCWFYRLIHYNYCSGRRIRQKKSA